MSNSDATVNRVGSILDNKDETFASQPNIEVIDGSVMLGSLVAPPINDDGVYRDKH